MNMGDVRKFAEHWYGTMIKGTVDVAQNRVALGGDYQIESAELLVQNGSKSENVWGFNLRFEEDNNGVLEFDSMVNLKPAYGNRSRSVENLEIQEKIKKIVAKLVIK